MRTIGILVVSLMTHRLPAQAINYPLQALPLTDGKAFTSFSKNWRIAGDAFADRSIPGHMEAGAGTGVLVNTPDPANRANLTTVLEHGDLELEFDFMMAAGSNSGVYLQGRYEIQLFDSWAKPTVSYKDCGGIYQRRDVSRGKGAEGYEGHPPRQNASRAPGLWQHIRAQFQAPRFNERGQKMENARFVHVRLNGVLVQEHIELSGPTQSALFSEEKPTGPLFLQGDHGPVAFRNIRYKRLDGTPVKIESLRYQLYEGEFKTAPDLAQRKPNQTGDASGLVGQIGQRSDNFAVRYEGALLVPKAGVYRFDTQLTGGGRLIVNQTPLLSQSGQQASVSLEAGRVPFSLTYYKSNARQTPALGLFVEGPDTPRLPLHQPGSLPDPVLSNPILLQAGRKPTLLRSFLKHGEKLITHAISVAAPANVHYSFDLNQGALLQVWRGDFADVTDMWHHRGYSQLLKPLGSTLALPGRPSIATLPDQDAPWPDSLASERYTYHGYRLDPAGYPTFAYRSNAVEIQDRILSDPGNRYLIRTLTLTSPAPKNLYLLLTEGNPIRQLPDGSYAVGDRIFYVNLTKSTARPFVRKRTGTEELLLPIPPIEGRTEIEYAIIW